MKDFLRTGLEILFVITAIAFMPALFQEISNTRRLPVDAVVLETRRVDEGFSMAMGGNAWMQTVRIRSFYTFEGVRHEISNLASLVSRTPKPPGEFSPTYAPGAKIVVWVDPEQPDDARLIKRGTTPYVLPLIFLGLLFLVTLIFYVRLKDD